MYIFPKRTRRPDGRSPVPVPFIVSPNGQVAHLLRYLVGFEVMGNPPLLAEGKQGGQQGSLTSWCSSALV